MILNVHEKHGLAQLSLPHVRAMMDSATLATPQAGVPQGGFYASGIRQVELGSDACFIGHRAYESCKLLTLVDISGTEIHTLHMHSQCHSLETVKLPSCLREIREVFIGCNALVNLTLPGSIRYIGYRAFGNCAELSHLGYARRNKLEAWRYPYAAFNAFEECVKLATTKWLHYIPPRESDWIAPCN